MTTQLTSVPPDSALVGLAQLYGDWREQGADRLRARRVDDAASAPDPRQVRRSVACWPSTRRSSRDGSEPSSSAAPPSTCWLALGVVVYSLVHGLITMASVVGNRLKVGILGTVANGIVQTVLAGLAFGRWWGLKGIAVAGPPRRVFVHVHSGGSAAAAASDEPDRRRFLFGLLGPWMLFAPPALFLVLAAASRGRSTSRLVSCFPAASPPPSSLF